MHDDSYCHSADARIRELRTRVEAARRSGAKSRRRSRGRIEDLEGEVLFLSLLNRALLEVVLTKGLCTKDELVGLMQELDGLDGEADGGLAPEAVADELGVELPTIDKVKAFSRSMQEGKSAPGKVKAPKARKKRR